jgi:hypothetical protein
MTNELANVQQKSMIPSDHEMMVFQTMAKQAVGSKLYRGIGDEFAVMTIMLAARELDIPPMAALNGGINIIQGKTEISARMMAALIIRRGGTISVEESTDQKCVLKGIRSNGQVGIESFTIEEAKKAGLVKVGGGWEKWPKDMLYARCISRLARRLFPDVIGMGYVEGEIKESLNNPTLSPDTELTVAEVIPEAEDESVLLQNFLSEFDKQEALGWSTYISQLREKLNLSIKTIIEKYKDDPIKATEKYQQWLAKHMKNP